MGAWDFRSLDYAAHVGNARPDGYGQDESDLPSTAGEWDKAEQAEPVHAPYESSRIGQVAPHQHSPEVPSTP